MMMLDKLNNADRSLSDVAGTVLEKIKSSRPDSLTEILYYELLAARDTLRLLISQETVEQTKLQRAREAQREAIQEHHRRATKELRAEERWQAYKERKAQECKFPEV